MLRAACRIALAFVGSIAILASANAQNVGDACAVNGAYAAPSSAGQIIKCVASAWAAVNQPAAAAGSTGQIQFNSSGALGASSKFVWDNTNGRVGIGTTGPNAPLHIYSASSGANAAVNAQMIIEATGSRYIQFALPTASTGGLYFGNSTNNILGSLTYNNSSAASYPNSMAMTVANSGGWLRLNSTGLGLWTNTPGSTLQVGGNAAIGYSTSTAGPSNGLVVSGNVGIGTTGPSYPLDIVGDIRTSTCLHYASSSLGTCSSDARIKRDVKPFDLGLAAVAGLKPVTFFYNGLGGNPDDGRKQMGLIAQDVEKVAPSLVVSRKAKLNPKDKEATDVKAVDYGALDYMLVNAVRELKVENDNLRRDFEAYKRAHP